MSSQLPRHLPSQTPASGAAPHNPKPRGSISGQPTSAASGLPMPADPPRGQPARHVPPPATGKTAGSTSPHMTFGHTRSATDKPTATPQPAVSQQPAESPRSTSSLPMRRRLIERLSTGQGQREAMALRVILGPPVAEQPSWPYRR